MLLRINSQNPEGRKIRQVVESLRKGGIIIYPTDTVYAFACDIEKSRAAEGICKLRGLDPKKATLSIVCSDISQISGYTRPIGNETFRLLKKNLPGPFTFILEAGNRLSKSLANRKKTVGVRIPDHAVVQAILGELGRPLLSASLYSEDEMLEYMSDPTQIYDEYRNKVDVLIDSGPGGMVPSTVVDCTGPEPLILREGAGELR